MLFLLEVSSLKQIKENIDRVDGFIMGYESFTSFCAKKFSFVEIEEATTISKNIYINLNEKNMIQYNYFCVAKNAY